LFLLACWFLAIHVVLVCLRVSFRPRPPRVDRMAETWIERERLRSLRDRDGVR
jgi:hypothetical protein